MLRRPTTAAACAVALLALSAAPATALTQPVDIAVLIAAPAGPDPEAAPLLKAFAVEGVTPGAGPELTAADFVPVPDGAQDPADLCGSVDVDIDPDGQTVTVTGTADELPCEVGLVSVTILSEEIGAAELVLDELVTGVEGQVVPNDTEPAAFSVSWVGAVPGDPLPLTDGSSRAEYELVAIPTPPPAPEPEPAPEPAPG